MKSVLQQLALLSSILLIVSCGGDGGTASNVVVTDTTPNDGAAGQSVKGVISGASVTVVDSAGVSLNLSGDVSTGDDGTYALTFSDAQISSGLTTPYVVTITGGTSTCDYDAPGTDDDCALGDGTFVAFGGAVPLPADFEIVGMIASIPASSTEADPIVTVNVSPASDIAVGLAQSASGGAAFTEAQAQQANDQVLGILSVLTGVDMSGLTLNEIPLVDATADSNNADEATAALTAFAAAVFGQIDATNTSVGAVLDALLASVTVNADGSVSLTGTVLASIANSMANALDTLAARGSTAAAAVSSSTSNNALVFAAAGDTLVTIAPVGGTGDADLDATRAFIGKFKTLISDVAAATGSGGSLPEGTGTTEVIGDALSAAEDVASASATAALYMLESAIVAAEAEGLTDLSMANEMVTGTLAVGEDGTVTVTDASASYTDQATGVTTTITVSGDRSTGTGTAAFNATAATLVSSVTEGETTTVLQTFTGTLAATFASQTVDLGLTSLTLTGDIVAGAADSGPSLAMTATITEITGTDTDGAINGNFETSFTFSGVPGTLKQVVVNVNGAIGGSTFGYAVTSATGSPLGTTTLMGSSTRTMNVEGNGYTDTHNITDGTAVLTLEIMANVLTGPGLTPDGQSDAGALTVNEGATATGVVSADGVVYYSDGSLEILPDGL